MAKKKRIQRIFTADQKAMILRRWPNGADGPAGVDIWACRFGPGWPYEAPAGPFYARVRVTLVSGLRRDNSRRQFGSPGG
jgi:hypothetical protein